MAPGGMLNRFPEQTSGGGATLGIDLLPSSLGDNFSPVDTRSWAEIDDMVGRTHGVLVVLDHQERVTAVSKISQDAKEFLIVAGMKTDGGFIEDIENALKVGAELGGQTDSLGFPARKSRGGAVEIEIVETHFPKEGKALKDFGLDIAHDGGFSWGEFDF